MAEYNPNFPSDEGRRDRALEQALSVLAEQPEPPADIVARAAAFEAYLRDGLEPPVKAEESDSTPSAYASASSAQPPLPYPAHSNWGPDKPCLACEWLKLRKKILDATQ